MSFIVQLQLQLKVRLLWPIEMYVKYKMYQMIIYVLNTSQQLADQLAATINAVGKIRLNDKAYVPKIVRVNHTADGKFIPQSEQICLSILRGTVVALSDSDLATVHRRRFYQNNFIPGSKCEEIAQDDPILINPDGIMPSDYGIEEFENDISRIRVKLNFLNRKVPKYFQKRVTFEPGGTKSISV